MAAFARTPTHFDGVALTSGTFKNAHFTFSNGTMNDASGIGVVAADVVGRGAQYVRSQPQGRVLELHFHMAAIQDSDRDTVIKTFDPDKALAFVRATDGAGTSWRMAAAVISVSWLNAIEVLVKLFVPAPALWEENTATTTSRLAKSGDSDSHTMTNNGNKTTKPKVTITPRAVKGPDPAYDFISTLRGFIVNRSPDAWANLPVQVCDQGGADGTRDLASVVKVAGISNQINLGGGIGSGDSSWSIDTAVGGGLPASGGFFIFDDGVNVEQCYYGVKSGTVINNVQRGVGGTTARAWPDNSVMYMSGMLRNASDFRLYQNGLSGDAWVAVPNGTSRIWGNMSMPARVKLIPTVTLTSGPYPANDSYLQFYEGVGAIADVGIFAIESELIGYTGRDLALGRVTGIRRGMWGTAVANHAAAAPAFFNPILFVHAAGYFFNPDQQPPSQLERRPAIQLKTSKNKEWRWGDLADDVWSRSYDPAYPNRTAMWLPSSEVPAGPFPRPDDQNRCRGMRIETNSAVEFGWTDDVPLGGKPEVPRYVMNLPQRSHPHSSTVLTYDAQKRDAVRLRAVGETEDGIELNAIDLQDVNEALVTGQNKTIPDMLKRVVLSGVRAPITGDLTAAAASIGQNNTAQELCIPFELKEDSRIEAVELKLKKSGGGDSFTFECLIRDNTPIGGSRPVDAALLGFFTTGGATTAGGITTGFVNYLWTANTGDGMQLKAGVYQLCIRISVFGSGNLLVAGGNSKTGSQQMAYQQAGAGGGYIVNGILPWYRVLHANGGPVQAEVDVLASQSNALFKNIILKLNDGTGTYSPEAYTPYVDREGGTGIGHGSVYHCNGRLTNSTTGDYVDIDCWLETNQSLEIDFEARTVRWIVGNWSMEVAGVVNFSNRADLFRLAPGNNSIVYDEFDMSNTDIVFEHRGKAAA